MPFFVERVKRKYNYNSTDSGRASGNCSTKNYQKNGGRKGVKEFLAAGAEGKEKEKVGQKKSRQLSKKNNEILHTVVSH